MTFGSFPTNVLTNVLILKRFVNNILSRFIHLNKKRGREAFLFPEKDWTLFGENWITSSLFLRKGWTSSFFKKDWTTSSFSGEDWTFFKEGWTLFREGWTLFGENWTFFGEGWTLFGEG